jgi:hypothetical protein
MEFIKPLRTFETSELADARVAVLAEVRNPRRPARET